MQEEWRPIAGYEGWYSVSNLGRVRRDRGGISTQAGRICKPTVMRGGYLRVGLCAGSHASLRMKAVHHLVAEAFIGPRPPGYVINHINHITDDNRPENLEWVTPKGNSEHMVRAGRSARGDQHGKRRHPESSPRGDAHHARLHPENLARGSRHGNTRLTEDDVRTILTSSLPHTVLARQYGVAPSTIAFIRQRVTWKHVTVT